MEQVVQQDDWSPEQYLQFAHERTRPALDLIGHIALADPKTIVDLGCGAGNVTRLLRSRWPDAQISAVDNSPAMIERAKSEQLALGVDWILDDIATWDFPAPPDLIFSNAALHWMDHHRELFPRLFSRLAPGGVLAVQMPNNFSAASHTLMLEVAKQGPWADKLAGLLRPTPVSWPGAYKQWLSADAKKVRVWETQYMQIFEGEDPVFEWIKGTSLAPLLGALDFAERGAFITAYKARLNDAYPQMSNGRVMYPMRRIFVVAEAA